MVTRPGERVARHDGKAVLRGLVGVSTLSRGSSYAASGAVVVCRWDDDGLGVTGQVQGTGRAPYDVEVTVTRSASGQLTSFTGLCSCPVTVDCKHAVALLLAAPPAGQRLLQVVEEPRATSEWERRLRALLEAEAPSTDRRQPDPSVPSPVALQFDLVPARAAAGWRAPASGAGIRLRPVTRSASGNWVRTGISWSQLPYISHGTAVFGSTAEQLAGMKELRALALLEGRRWSAHGDEQVWLESVGSRRVWDLLRHIADLGVPLVGAGRDAAPVTIEPAGATAEIDLLSDDSGLQARAGIRCGELDVVMSSALLIGSPAHGVAWWTTPPVGASTPPLHVAQLSHPVGDALAELVRAGPLRVPARDAERFERDVYPQLRRIVTIRSSDGSHRIPDATPDAVLLTVAHGDGASIRLQWRLRTGSGALRALEDRPDSAARSLVEELTALVGTVADLVEATPWGPRLRGDTQLEGMAAARFATEVLPALEAIDGLQVDQRGDAVDYHETDAAPVVRLAGSESDHGDWLDLAVEVEVDGEEVPYVELFTALAEGHTHLLLPSGTYFSLDRPDLRRLAELIAEARALQDAPPGRVRLGRFQASLWDELDAVATLDAQAGAWTDAVGALLGGGQVVEHPAPDGLRASLRPYQLEGFRWLASRYEHRLGGILADEMGLGKTLQVLALVCHAGADAARPPGYPFLVVAPTSVVGNWVAEADRFAPGLRVVAVTATERRRGLPLADVVTGADLVVTSYALLRLEHEAYDALDWAGLILDEAQFAKNPSSVNHHRARSLPAPWKLAVTGTPLENSLQELWALTSITAPGLFARQERFNETYRTPIEKQGDEARLGRLRRRIRPIMLRRTKTQVARDLPDKQEQILELDLHPRHRKVYDTYLHRERQKVLGMLGDMNGNRFEIFRSLTLLRQASLDVSLVDPTGPTAPSSKLDAMTEMLTEVVADGHRVLVFSQFTRYLGMARDRLESAGVEVSYLDGSTRRRASVINGWRTGTAPVFLISLKAGGFGLNLAEADYCILLDPWWNPAAEAQAVDRTHRIGQTRKVMVYRLVAKDTIEEKVMALKARKAALFASVIDGGGFENATLSAADVRELLE